jgi:hypothetical protein
MCRIDTEPSASVAHRRHDMLQALACTVGVSDVAVHNAGEWCYSGGLGCWRVRPSGRAAAKANFAGAIPVVEPLPSNQSSP